MLNNTEISKSENLAKEKIDIKNESSDLLVDKSASLPILKPKKDFWDKTQAVAPIISGFLVFVTGAYFTYTYNQQQLKLMEVQTIEKFIPHLMGNEKSKKAAILALSFLTNTKIASKFAGLFASQGTVSALKTIAQNGNDEDKVLVKKALAQSMEELEKKESQISQIQSQYETMLKAQNQSKQDILNNITPLEKIADDLETNGDIALSENLNLSILNLKLKFYSPDSKVVLSSYKKLARLYTKDNKLELANQYQLKINKIENSSSQDNNKNSINSQNPSIEDDGSAQTNNSTNDSVNNN